MCYWCVFNVIKCWLYGLVDQIIIWCSDGRSRAPSERRIVSRQRTDEGENCTLNRWALEGSEANWTQL